MSCPLNLAHCVGRFKPMSTRTAPMEPTEVRAVVARLSFG